MGLLIEDFPLQPPFSKRLPALGITLKTLTPTYPLGHTSVTDKTPSKHPSHGI